MIIRFFQYSLLVSLLCSGQERPRLHPLLKQSLNAKSGPEIGSRISPFEAVDQDGKRQTFESLRGPKGLVLEFDRSADWCPSCKGQLIDLNSRVEAFRKRGLGVAAITYDSTTVLRNFASRKGIGFPLLSDPESKVIRAFGLLNGNIEPSSPAYGIAFPGTFLIDENGIIRAKYFEEDVIERYSAANILTQEFGETGNAKTVIESPHLRLSSSATDTAFAPGRRIGLILEIDLKPGMHVYAPGVEGGYKPIEWSVPGSKSWLAFDAKYPPSRSLHLAAIQETVPVYVNRLRLFREITIGQEEEISAVMKADRSLTIAGEFRYQACDDKQCYPPRNIPLEWTFQMGKRETERVPAELQRR